MPASFSNIDPMRTERDQAACYIATLAAELAVLAKQHNLGTLAYLLDMARLEADNQSRPASPPATLS